MTLPQLTPMNTEPVQAPAEAKPADQNLQPIDTKQDVLDMQDAPMIADGSDVEVIGVATEGFLKEKFPGLATALDSVLSLLTNTRPVERQLGDFNRLSAILTNTDFMTLGPLLVDVPEGLNTDYLTYLKVVERLYLHAEQAQSEVLTPLQRHLSQLISSNHHRYVYNPVLDKKIRKFNAEREEIRTALNKCFTDTGKTKLHYDRAFRRNGDWAEIYSVVERLQKQTKLSPASVQKQVQEISELTNHLAKLSSAGEIPGMDQQTYTATEFWVRTAAEEVSMISVGYYHANAATTCLANVVKQLVKNYG